jgi:hypothetical protein
MIKILIRKLQQIILALLDDVKRLNFYKFHAKKGIFNLLLTFFYDHNPIKDGLFYAKTNLKLNIHSKEHSKIK